ncbi:DUF6745 domain-containing protein [Dactylosporangium sucinum]|uniref:DUF6745 domain-containing protein n=1 Tax=Dactylosporangium sucinum TaxID=1424081 RepID=A0A917X6M0_9ACTN|nr:tetratricopeptide repeat protein [Dactylosporangium sucinum]GGM87344.1 hypothetical protein GCM10007977_106610 [Dactylosporangium sucinum]
MAAGRIVKVERLTPEQEALVVVVRDEWLVAGWATGPADRRAAERGVAEAYRAAGLQPPRLVVWLDSPYAGAIGAWMLAEVRERVGSQVWAEGWSRVWDQVRAQVGEQVASDVLAQVGPTVGDKVLVQPWDQASEELGAQFEAQVLSQVSAQVWAQVWSLRQGEKHIEACVRDQVGKRVWKQVVGDEWSGHRGARAAWGPRWGDSVVFHDVFRRLGVSGCQRLAGQMTVARNAGWWWPFQDAVVLTERPTELHRDDQGRLHHPTGPAVRYPDGFAVYAWHGVQVDERLVTGRLTGRNWLAADNAEVRRVIAERLGYRRILDDLQHALAICRRAGDRHGEGKALGDLGGALIHAERFDEAIDVHRQAATVFGEFGYRHGEGTALNNLGEALQQVRRFDEAIDVHLQAAAIFDAIGDHHGEGTALTNLGLVLRNAGRVDEARACWLWALDEFNSCDSPAEFEAVRTLLDETASSG